MSKIKDVLRRLNQGRDKDDMFKIASETPREEFDLQFVSTGSVYLDYMLKGGVPLGALTLFTGWESAGKTSVALVAGAQMQKATGKFLVFMDGERTINNSHIDRFGLDRELLIVRKESNLEEMLDTAEAFSKTEDVGMIIIDSVKSFYSTTVEEKSAIDNYIGIEAKRLGGRMSIISANCARRNISLMVINQWRENPGVMMGDTRVLPGGNWQKYMTTLHLDFTKKDLIKNSEGKVIGNIMDVRVKKSKFSSYDPKAKITLSFYYGGGFDSVDEYAAMFIDAGIIEKSGTWFSFPNADGEEVKLQGKNNVVEHLKVNDEDFNKLLLNFLKDEQ